MFAFLLSHFANHILGLFSLAAMEGGRAWIIAPWRHPVSQWVLLLALLVHWLLGLWLIYRRRTLRMPVWEAVQILFGLAIPPLLVYHAVGMYMAYQQFGTSDLYARLLLYFWVLDPVAGMRQFALFVVAWTHGCMGLHYWLRIRAWYPRIFPVLLAALVLIPVLALLGTVNGAREVSDRANDPAYIKQLTQPASVDADSGYGSGDAYGSSAGSSAASDPYQSNSYGSDSYQRNAYSNEPASKPDEGFTTIQLRDAIIAGIWLLLGLTLLARIVRSGIRKRGDAVSISYFNGPEVRIPVGSTLLEASRSARLPHASACGGRARCSTCRVRIGGDPTLQPAPSATEQQVLNRIGAGANVRLACQLRPRHDLTVTRLVPVAINTDSIAANDSARGGQEREIAILFADLRGFTRIAERKLPYDVVYILNRYFEAVGSAIADAGGIANQYTGDGVMSLFGVNTDDATACRQAIVAAGDMIARIESLSEMLGSELDTPLRIGIGIHMGPVVVGEMGYAGTRYLTAVGDTVNTTSRLEALTKEYQCELIVSKRVLDCAEIPASDLPHHELALRNRDEPLELAVVGDARAFARRLHTIT
jgi:adenylate cyclase